MTRIIITAAALLFSTSAFAQTVDSSTSGATSKVIAMGGHYTVHQVFPDGTIVVKTLTGEEAKLVIDSQPKLALLSAQ